MEVHQLDFIPEHGWSAEFPACDGGATLVLVFGATTFMDKPEPLHELVEAYPNSVVAGCSTSGEIANDAIRDDSLSVAVVRFDGTEVRRAVAPIDDASQSATAGATLATQLAADDLAAILVLSDGLNVNGTDLVRGLNGVLPPDVVVTGGLAGDGDRFQRTWTFAGDDPKAGQVVAVGLYGDKVKVGHGSKGGWDIFGPERTVTKSDGNVLYELDGQPALDLYKNYLGEQAAGLPATGLLFPLALRSADEPEKTLVRTILAIDEEKNSMTFAGDIPEGHRARLMKANFDRLIEGAESAALMTRNRGSDGDNTLAVAVSCVGRRLILGDRTEEEVEVCLELLPPGTTLVGFYSYGELSPYASGACDLHNQTMTLTTIHEA